jgi:hypothetical protein
MHSTPLNFPSLDGPYDSADSAEQLMMHPTVVVASNKIVAAADHMAVIVQMPFLSLRDASMAVHDFSSICMMIHPKVALFIHQYHLPSCL